MEKTLQDVKKAAEDSSKPLEETAKAMDDLGKSAGDVDKDLKDTSGALDDVSKSAGDIKQDLVIPLSRFMIFLNPPLMYPKT